MRLARLVAFYGAGMAESFLAMGPLELGMWERAQAMVQAERDLRMLSAVAAAQGPGAKRYAAQLQSIAMGDRPGEYEEQAKRASMDIARFWATRRRLQRIKKRSK